VVFKVIGDGCEKNAPTTTRLHSRIKSEEHEKATPETITERKNMKLQQKRMKLTFDLTINRSNET
jgi:hypothetical protein